MNDVHPRFVVLGHPVSHSLSPRLHRAAFEELGIDEEYKTLDVPPEYFEQSLARLYDLGVLGLSVTAPLKELARRCARRQSQEVAVSGVANCLRRTEGGFEATNTDGLGFMDFLEEVGISIESETAVLLGGGGAAAGLAPALGRGGALVSVIARRPEIARSLPGLQELQVHAWGSPTSRRVLSEARLVVNCTPLGAGPQEELPCSPQSVSADTIAVDLRYRPRPTPWLQEMADHGHTAYDGLGLLVHQAAHALRFWFDREPPLSRLRDAVQWNAQPTPARPPATESG